MLDALRPTLLLLSALSTACGACADRTGALSPDPEVSTEAVVIAPPTSTAAKRDPQRREPALRSDERAFVEALAHATGVSFGPGDAGERCRRHDFAIASPWIAGTDARTFELHDCSAVFDESHRRYREVLRSGPHAVELSRTRLVADGRVLFDMGARCTRMMTEQICPGTFEGAALRLLSMVGPVVTYAEDIRDSSQGVPIAYHQTWRTVDARTGKLASLTALVNEPSLVTALQADPYVNQRLPASSLPALASATSLAEVLALWEESESYELFGGYAFTSERKGELVGMRLAFRRVGWAESTGELSTLGLLVQPVAEAQVWFEAAHSGQGRLMSVE